MEIFKSIKSNFFLEMKTRTYTSITATWGNDDASSTIKISRKQWESIKSGQEFSVRAWSRYEGKRMPVCWKFNNSLFSVFNDDGFQAVLDDPLDELHVEEILV